MAPKEFDKFRELLDEHYNWPSEYLFKFIVPMDSVNDLITILGEAKIQKKPSKKGNYISITAVKIVNHAEEVIDLMSSNPAEAMALIRSLILRKP